MWPWNISSPSTTWDQRENDQCILLTGSMEMWRLWSLLVRGVTGATKVVTLCSLQVTCCVETPKVGLCMPLGHLLQAVAIQSVFGSITTFRSHPRRSWFREEGGGGGGGESRYKDQNKYSEASLVRPSWPTQSDICTDRKLVLSFYYINSAAHKKSNQRKKRIKWSKQATWCFMPSQPVQSYRGKKRQKPDSRKHHLKDLPSQICWFIFIFNVPYIYICIFILVMIYLLHYLFSSAS